MSKRWDWFVRGYYNNAVKPPKKAGSLAIEVGGKTRQALDMDVDVLKQRDDIGRIELQDPYSNVTILKEVRGEQIQV